VGIHAANRIARLEGRITEEREQEIADVLTAFGLPSRASFEPSVVRDRMQSDKKSTAGHQTWVLPNGSKEVDLVTGIGDESEAVREESADDFLKNISAAYTQEFQITPGLFVCVPGEGAREIS